MEHDLAKYAADLDILLQLSLEMAGERDLDRLLDKILGAAKRLTAADRCSCFVVDDRTGELLTRVAQGAKTIRLPRGSGIAGSVAETAEVVNIPDVYQDPRFNPDNDRRSGYRTSSMLCMPLVGHAESVVGVLQALNKDGGAPFEAYDERILHLLCNQAAVAIETAQFIQREAERQRLVRDMEVARTIQASLLPDDPPTVVGWRFAAWQRPCDATGGDYHDYLTGADFIDLVVGDVSGHGIGAALYMSTARAFLRALHDQLTPTRLMERLNQLLEADMPDDAFMTMLLVRLRDDGTVAYVSAGHEPPLVYRAELARFDDDEPTGLLLGALDQADYESVSLPPLQASDVLVLFTDGIFEAANAAGEEWGVERFRSCVAAHAARGPHGVISGVVEAVSSWIGTEPVQDDWTLLVAERVA